jgi:hypothetical protein
MSEVGQSGQRGEALTEATVPHTFGSGIRRRRSVNLGTSTRCWFTAVCSPLQTWPHQGPSEQETVIRVPCWYGMDNRIPALLENVQRHVPGMKSSTPPSGGTTRRRSRNMPCRPR